MKIDLRTPAPPAPLNTIKTSFKLVKNEVDLKLVIIDAFFYFHKKKFNIIYIVLTNYFFNYSVHINSSQNIRLPFLHFWAFVAKSELPRSVETILYDSTYYENFHLLPNWTSCSHFKRLKPPKNPTLIDDMLLHIGV